MYYGTLDQRWLTNKLDLFQIDNYDLTATMADFGFSASQILDSINPAIYCTCELIIQQFIERPAMEDFSDDFKDRLREQLQESIFTNCIDSHIGFEYIFEQNRDELLEELETNFLDSNDTDLLNPDYRQSRLEELESEYLQLFCSYDF
jgi:hypothetical protein